ncbi:F-box/LRR-repeat protein 17 [Diachasma alloeum]|uniref:F-box/LRR-repeat protein 17 n=1 Tax=Diachasma alloeum TaxID=454923 RepID=UPI0007381345|nr:F-box/LRR-repeat protein 17 [Diachasma alloeum]
MASPMHDVEQPSEVSGGSRPVDHINKLDNVLLLKIFFHLSPGDKLNAEKVCKRWRVVSKVTWKNMKRLRLIKTTSGRSDYDKLPDVYKNIQSMAKILKRCGRYLQVLELGSPCHYTMIPFALEHCRNLVTLNISLYPVACDMSSISEITSLKSFSLERMTNRSDSAIFRVLPRRTLRGIHLRASEYGYDINGDQRLHLPDNYNNYLRDLNNLVSIQLHYFHVDHAMEEIINQNVKLDFLSLSNSMINGPFFLTALRNLKILDLENVTSVTNTFLQQLSITCPKLTILNLGNCNEIDDGGIVYLWDLLELKLLNLDDLGFITDAALGEFHTLRLLSLRNCRAVKDTELITLMIFAINLRSLNVKGTKVTHELLVAANRLSKRRLDGVPLRIYVDTSVIANWVDNNDSPLLIVESTDNVRNQQRSQRQQVCDEDDDPYDSDYEFQYEAGSDSEADDCGDNVSGEGPTTELATSDSDD